MSQDPLLHRSIEHLRGPKEIPYGEDELVVVCLVRDGRPYVNSFVEHYFSLGVKHIVFLDNNSSDGTVEALKKYDNVSVFRTNLPFKEYQNLMRRYLITHFGKKGRWCLCVDIDELFDYPYSDAVPLDSLLRYLMNKSYSAVTAHMLDMFPEKPLSDQPGTLDVPLKELHKFYDISNITRKSMTEDLRLLRHNNTYESHVRETFHDGIRHTVFNHRSLLTKQPLVFLDGKAKHMGRHWVNNARVADITGVLFHYKFLDGYLHRQARQAVREEQYPKNSQKYKKYLKVLEKSLTLQIKQESAREIKSVNDLVEDRFLVLSEDYVAWVNAQDEKSILVQAPQQEAPCPVKASLELRKLKQQPENMQASCSWKLMKVLHRIKVGILSLGRSLS